MELALGPVSTVDYHTAGEPFRIVLDGVPVPSGDTVLERRAFAQGSDEFDMYRRLLVSEPRGHSDMYGCFVVPPDDEGADFGVLFWHKDGYSTACGHGTIALGCWAVQSGRVAADPDGETEVVIDVPSGRVRARVTCRHGAVQHVVFGNVGSHVVARAVPVRTSRGEVHVDISYGGAFYVSVPADAFGLRVQQRCLDDLTAIGREVKWLLNDSEWARHPDDPRLDGIYGTILFDDLGDTEAGPHQRNVTVFADGEVDRSPCGSGTSARLALLAADGRLAGDRVLTHDSIIGTTFTGRALASADGRIATEVLGSAFRTGTATFTLDPDDPLGAGFLLR